MNIVVSIIVATYNSEKTLMVALDSISKQTFNNWECIVVDGASKDNTLRIVEDFEKKDSRFRHISEPDSGIYDAFNKGWKLARGEWVLYLGSDDELCQDGLDILVQQKSQYDIVYGDVYLKFANGTKKLQKARSTSELKQAKRLPCCHQSLMMKKKVFVELNGFDLEYRLLADFDLCVRAFHKGFSFHKVSGIISVFSVTGASHSDMSSSYEFDKIYRRYNNGLKSFFEHYIVLFKLLKNNLKHKYIDG